MTNEEWDILVAEWKAKYGQEKVTRSGNTIYTVPAGDARNEMYAILAQTLIDNKGFSKQELIDITNRVVNVSVYLDHKDRKKLNSWKDFCKNDWQAVVYSLFPTDFSDNVQVKIERKPVNNENDYERVYDQHDYEEEVVMTNPLDRSKLPRVIRDGPPPMSTEELRAMLYADDDIAYSSGENNE